MVRTFYQTQGFGLTTVLALVVNLHDVQTTVQQEKDVDDQHDPPLILLEKWATLKRHAISALWYPLPPTNEGNSHGVFDREASIH